MEFTWEIRDHCMVHCFRGLEITENGFVHYEGHWLRPSEIIMHELIRE